MSTFDGVIHEFPDILIDYFRFRGRPPRLCLLSHVHSDHLAGLETLQAPFVYCSAATREMLLRLEKYPCRVNYASGKLEARKQTYKHLNPILKPIPLETPTKLELWPGSQIQVTLFDANHCVGAVMFLIEGDGKAVLYTGDIRSEPWWINSITRSPAMVQYANGIKTLDRIYLDTSNLDNYPLETKAEGLRYLLTQVARYPADTIFFVQAWTYGYEDVWVALANALGSKIHVDAYKMGVHKSLVQRSSADLFAKQIHLAKEAPYLVGFSCANNQHDGCLTLDESVRIHSCEKGTACHIVQGKPIVWIRPIVSRLPGGREIPEVGIGGGGGDLERAVELQYIPPDSLEEAINMIRGNEAFPVETRQQVMARILTSNANGRNAYLNIDIDDLSADMETDLAKVIHSVTEHVSLKAAAQPGQTEDVHDRQCWDIPDSMPLLPSTINFPYARHSSYSELRHLVDSFRPKDIWPCTVHDLDWLTRGITLRDLFGQHCSGDIFYHDNIMKRRRAQLPNPLAEGYYQLGESKSTDGVEKRGLRQQETEDKPRHLSPVASNRIRVEAFDIMRRNARGDIWASINLISTTGNHSVLDIELGAI